MTAVARPRVPEPVTTRRFFAALRARWLGIALFVLGVGGAAAGVALWIPPWYTAETTLLPPAESSDVFTNMTGLIERSAMNKLGMLSTATPSDVYVEILQSRRLRGALVRKFDLSEVYKVKGMDRTLKELEARVKMAVTSSGVIEVRVVDGERGRAAAMANFLVGELDRFNRETLNTRGKQTRQFLDGRVAEVEGRLHEAETKLTDYEQAHKVVVDEAAVRGVAEVMAQKLSLQVRRAYMTSYSTPGSAGVREMDAQITAFDRELGQLPGVKNEGARLALEAEIQRKLYTLLTAQFEEARIQEMRDTPTVTVLDEAEPPEIKTGPKRTVMVVGSIAVALVMALGWVWLSLRRGAVA